MLAGAGARPAHLHSWAGEQPGSVIQQLVHRLRAVGPAQPPTVPVRDERGDCVRRHGSGDHRKRSGSMMRTSTKHKESPGARSLWHLAPGTCCQLCNLCLPAAAPPL